MTEKLHNWLINWAKMIGSVVIISSFASAVLGFVATMVMATYGDRIIAGLGLATTAHVAGVSGQIATLSGDVQSLQRQVQILSAPRDIVDYSRASRVEGPCRRGQVCMLVVRVKRVPGAEGCRIIGDLTDYTLISDADLIKRRATRSGQARARNIGGEFETFEIPLLMPRSMPLGAGELQVETNYTDCPWQIQGAPPVADQSPPFRIEVVQ